MNEPNDFIIATGKLRSVRNFLEISFEYLGLDYKEFVKVNPKFYRASEHVALCGNTKKLELFTDWQSTKELKNIIEEMIKYELKRHAESNANP